MPASLPFIEPCVPRASNGCIDGWRCQAVKVGKTVTRYSRHGHDLTKRFPTIAAAVAQLSATAVSLDDELVQADARGIDFYSLLGKQTRNVSLMAFDVLALDGKDLRGLPLEERLAQLDMLLNLNTVAGIAMVPSFDDGEALMLGCMEHGLEGVVSKRRDAPYRSGRGPTWLKSKTPTWRQANKDRWERLRAR